MRTRGLALVLCSGLLLPATGLAAFYKCTVDGRTVYQSTPCAPGAGDAVELAPINSLGGKPAVRAPAAPRETLPPAPAGKRGVEPLAVPEGWFRGYAGYTAALRESERNGAPVFLYFYTDWCPYCRNFSSRVLPDPGVTQALRGYLKVQLNVDAGPEEAALQKRFGGRGIPFLVALNDGKPAVLTAVPNPKGFLKVLSTQAGGR